jgi:L-alanine-DL-glutamate epimerase-like enolase superfamily enzyme
MAPTTRRRFCASAAAAVAAAILEPASVVAQATKRVRIKNVDIFPIEIAIPEAELRMGKYARYTVAKVETDVGVTGYSFDRGSDYLQLDRVIRPALVGKDLSAIERHLKAGLVRWGGLEHAIWDATGKIANQPVHRLLGGARSSLPVYCTVVWRGGRTFASGRHRKRPAP